MAIPDNRIYREALFNSPQISNNSISANWGILHGNQVQANENLQNSSSSQSYDKITQSLSVVSPVNLVVSVKLEDDNYLIWYEKMMSYIIAYGLEGLLDGSIQKPLHFLSNGGVNSKFVNWIRLTWCLKANSTDQLLNRCLTIYWGRQLLWVVDCSRRGLSLHLFNPKLWTFDHSIRIWQKMASLYLNIFWKKKLLLIIFQLLVILEISWSFL